MNKKPIVRSALKNELTSGLNEYLYFFETVDRLRNATIVTYATERKFQRQKVRHFAVKALKID